MTNLQTAFEKIWATRPFVHHITNYVTVNDCANITLAAGGSPAMAHSIHEAGDMVANMHALVLNPGTITDEVFQGMLVAGKKASELGIPIILDPVAVGATTYRKKMNTTLLKDLNITIIRGNASEIMTLVGVRSGRGVDAVSDLTFDEEKVKAFARKQNIVISTSGEVDFVTDGERVAHVHNGVSMLSEITGSGCMVASLTGVAVGAGNDPFEGAVLALVMMGIAGERAARAVDGKRKLGTFRMELFNEIGTMTAETLKEEARVTND